MSKADNQSSILALDDMDRMSVVWLKVAAHLQARLDTLRRRLETDLAHEDTIRVRAQIIELKKLLAAGDRQDQH